MASYGVWSGKKIVCVASTRLAANATVKLLDVREPRVVRLAEKNEVTA